MKRFLYQKYDYQIKKGNFKISFVFKMEPENIYFKPQLTVKNIPSRASSSETRLENLIFHLGLMEIPTYWKAACAPKIIVEAGYLNAEQTRWWQSLIFKGMGQFFYENNLAWQAPKIISNKNLQVNSALSLSSGTGGYLVPVGGGKDSIVTLERLKKQRRKVNAFALNPTRAAKEVLKTAGIKKPMVAQRKIDPKLIELNQKGYFNGHTPFTAVLSFLSVFCAVLFGYKNIAMSCEKSADEGNIKYRGRRVNHQWSKSSEFEKMFKSYCQKYLVKDINYFSFLRKYTELEIAQMFAQHPKYFPVFSSCNRVAAKKLKRRWCGRCAKCLFVYTALYPYLEKKQLLKIFGKDLFEDRKLLPLMKSLIGQGKSKPFECVGTYQESRTAFKLSLKKAQRTGKIPYLLTKIK